MAGAGRLRSDECGVEGRRAGDSRGAEAGVPELLRRPRLRLIKASGMSQICNAAAGVRRGKQLPDIKRGRTSYAITAFRPPPGMGSTISTADTGGVSGLIVEG